MAYGSHTPHGDLIERGAETVALLTVKQAAARYGVSVSTIYRRVRAGRIVASKNSAGRWEIVNNGTTLAMAEIAAQLRDRLTQPTIPAQRPVITHNANGYATDMLARRRAILAAQRPQLIAA